MEVTVNPLEYIGSTLDKPGRALRGLIAGDPSQLLNLIPFSDATGITDAARDNISGREMLERLGVLGRNEDGLDWGDVAGFGVDVLSPSIPIGGAYNALSRLMGRGKPSVIAMLGRFDGVPMADPMNPGGLYGSIFEQMAVPKGPSHGEAAKELSRLLRGEGHDMFPMMDDSVAMGLMRTIGREDKDHFIFRPGEWAGSSELRPGFRSPAEFVDDSLPATRARNAARDAERKAAEDTAVNDILHNAGIGDDLLDDVGTAGFEIPNTATTPSNEESMSIWAEMKDRLAIMNEIGGMDMDDELNRKLYELARLQYQGALEKLNLPTTRWRPSIPTNRVAKYGHGELSDGDFWDSVGMLSGNAQGFSGTYRGQNQLGRGLDDKGLQEFLRWWFEQGGRNG